MNIVQKLSPRYITEWFLSRSISKELNDVTYLKLRYWAKMGKHLNLKSPITFNEKIQWLKVFDYKPLYTTMVDKYEVKQYVSNILGEKYVIPTIGVWDSFDDINFDCLPNQFVLKCTHDSGGLVICRDKCNFDINEAREKINRSLANNYYWCGRELPYKDVKPRILVEQYMQDGGNENLNVYKIFNFSGKPLLIQTIQNDKTTYETIDYFDINWNLLELKQNFPNSKFPLSRPEKLSEMLELARKLSEGFSILRTDFYMINGKIYFSEFTFYSDSGMAAFEPPEWDVTLGNKIILPKF